MVKLFRRNDTANSEKCNKNWKINAPNLLNSRKPAQQSNQINQSINQSSIHSFFQSINRKNNQSINQSNDHSFNQSIERSNDQSINRSMEQSIEESSRKNSPINLLKNVTSGIVDWMFRVLTNANKASRTIGHVISIKKRTGWRRRSVIFFHKISRNCRPKFIFAPALFVFFPITKKMKTNLRRKKSSTSWRCCAARQEQPVTVSGSSATPLGNHQGWQTFVWLL